MLTREDHSRIWNITDKLAQTGIVQDHKPKNHQLEDISIPQMEELFEIASTQIDELGYTMNRVNPKKANAILRVYRHEGWPHDYQSTFWTSGVFLYFRTWEGWISSQDIFWSSESFSLKHWLCQDDYVIINPHFVDYFVCINLKHVNNQR